MQITFSNLHVSRNEVHLRFYLDVPRMEPLRSIVVDKGQPE